MRKENKEALANRLALWFHGCMFVKPRFLSRCSAGRCSMQCSEPNELGAGRWGRSVRPSRRGPPPARIAFSRFSSKDHLHHERMSCTAHCLISTNPPSRRRGKGIIRFQATCSELSGAGGGKAYNQIQGHVSWGATAGLPASCWSMNDPLQLLRRELAICHLNLPVGLRAGSS